MIRIRELDHIVLRVRNLQAMLDFYCEGLGCKIERHMHKNGLIQRRAGASRLDLIHVDSEFGRAGGVEPGEEGLNLDHLCFRIDQFDARHISEHSMRLGIEVGELATRYGAEGYGPSIYVNDPDGNIVELKGPPEMPIAN